jgi:hypothetical protein
LIQIILLVFKGVALVVLGTTSIIALRRTIRNWKQRKGKYIFLPLTVLSVGIFVYVFNIGIFEAESTDRDELVGAFEYDFGFPPPPSVEEIKVKNLTISDAVAHWMAFTYDSLVLVKIVENDAAILVGERNSPEFIEAFDELHRENPNYAQWFKAPTDNVDKIYYKKDFMEHSYSRYYLYADKETNMIYLEISFFD